MRSAAELADVDRYCDAVPRSAATVEDFGSLRLFVPTAQSFHSWYARPSGAGPVTPDDLRAVLARQRELGLPQSLEWVQGRPSGLEQLAADTGLHVQRHPLLVASREELIPFEPQIRVRLVRPDDDLARVEAVATVAFRQGGTEIGTGGVESLDSAVDPDPERLALRAARVAAGHPTLVAAFVDGVPVARGSHTLIGDVTEITGVATLPAFRRQGLGSAVTAVLAEDAVRRGARLVWLSATDDAVARIYSTLGFREVGVACVADV
ncbi:MAG: GNAT family N-acetyltransferase [Mycobacteriales bacterium]